MGQSVLTDYMLAIRRLENDLATLRRHKNMLSNEMHVLEQQLLNLFCTKGNESEPEILKSNRIISNCFRVIQKLPEYLTE